MIYLRLVIYCINSCMASFSNPMNNGQKIIKPNSVDNIMWNECYDKLVNKFINRFIHKLSNIDITSQDDLKELHEFGTCLIRSIKTQIEYRKKLIKYQYTNTTIMSMQCKPNITTLKKYLDLITIITMWIESELIIDLQITPTPYNISCSNAKSARTYCKSKFNY